MPSLLDRILGREPRSEVLKPEEQRETEGMLKDLSEPIKLPDA
jgi:hypothetical protein